MWSVVGGESVTNLGKNHGGDLLGGEGLDLSEVFNLNEWRAILVNDLEGPRLDVLGGVLVVEAATNETPVEYLVRQFPSYLTIRSGIHSLT